MHAETQSGLEHTEQQKKLLDIKVSVVNHGKPNQYHWVSLCIDAQWPKQPNMSGPREKHDSYAFNCSPFTIDR